VKDLTFLARHIVRRNALSLRRAQGLVERETLAPDVQRLRQGELLRATLASARRHLPRYSGLTLPREGVDVQHWMHEHIPIVAKADLLACREELYPNGGRRQPWWPSGKTSGTSGTPLEVFRSVDSVVWEEAFNMQAWSWAGFAEGQRQAVLRGDQVADVARARPPFWRWDPFGQQMFMSTRHLCEANAPFMLDALRTARPSMLRAYPSAVVELARLTGKLGYRLQLPAVVTGSEPLYPVQREAIERAFGCKVFDFYGMAERIAYAAQCEHGHYHLHPEYSHVEILDEHNVPTDDFGFIVGTTLHNHVMPLLRYRITDRARRIPGTCPCGRHYPRIELASGKVEDQLYDLDGVPVSASIVTFAFKGLDHIRKSQVAQTGPGQWEVRIVPDPQFGERDAEALLANFGKYISTRLHVSVRLVEDIALQPSGKYKWVAQEWQGASAFPVVE
jgi:phenylacetate-CoA ligase